MQKLTWAPPCTSRPSRRCRPGPEGRQCPEHRDTSAPAPPPAPGTWHTVETCHSVTGLGVGLTWAPARLWRRESCRPVSGGWLASPHWPAHSVLQTHCSAADSRGQRVTSAVSPPARDPPPGTQYRGRRTSGGSGTRSSCCIPGQWEKSIQITWSWILVDQWGYYYLTTGEHYVTQPPHLGVTQSLYTLGPEPERPRQVARPPDQHLNDDEHRKDFVRTMYKPRHFHISEDLASGILANSFWREIHIYQPPLCLLFEKYDDSQCQ